MKRVLFVIPDLRGGGAEKVLVNLLNGLSKDKYEITLYTIFWEGSNRKLLTPDVRQKYLFKSVFRGYSVIQKFIPSGLLYRLLIGEKYDIVVAYLEGVPTRIVSGCGDPNTALISWLHTKIDDTNIEKVFWGMQNMKSAYQKFDQVVCVSNTARKALLSHVELNPDKVSVIHNSIDIGKILTLSQLDSPLHYSNEVVNLISVGRYIEVKGFERLLRVVLRLKLEGFRFHLYLLGDGGLRSDYEAFIKTNQLSSFVTLLGFHENPYSFVRAADLFVCSSYTEGFSTAVTEAILLEVPVITTDCSGMDEILSNGEFGLIVENNEEALFSGLRSLLSDAQLLKSYKEKARTRSSYFKSVNNVEIVENLFDSL